MRIDNSNNVEVTKTRTSIEMKGQEAVLSQEVTTGKAKATGGTVYNIKQTTVEKALFSVESELEKIKQAAENIDVTQLKKQMAILSNTISNKDYQKLQDEGYSLNDTQVETITTVMDKIKMELAKAGVDISVFGDSLGMEQLEDMTGNKAQAMQIAHALENADLPDSNQNHEDMVEVLAQSENLTKCSDGDVKYLLDNELPPTIDNLYKAQHSGSVSWENKSKEWMDDEKLKAQMEQVIKAAGLPVDDKTTGYTRFLISNEIPLTPENLRYMNQLKELEFPLEGEQVVATMTEAIAEGRRANDAMLLEGYSYTDRAASSMEVVAHADDQNLAYIVDRNLPLTIENLKQAQGNETVSMENVITNMEKEGKGEKEDTSNRSTKADIRLITARRQLEEARLSMTVQANYTLLKQGISIETEELEQVVEQLKSMEEDYYQTLLMQNKIEPTAENTELFAETTTKTEALKDMPAFALGRHYREPATVNMLYEAGSQVKASMEQAGQAYETMMTTPRSDLGDSMQKAFRNVDDILSELDLENSQANQRAVRMLGYNGLEITGESIAQMKAADQKVQNVFQNLTPSVVMELIREGINPLEVDIDTLNAKAEEIKEKLDVGQEEKFSKYLWELEQKQEITPEEKESYIGIYRLLHQINKTDGAVIGALVHQGGELSLKNLLGGVRSQKAEGMDVRVDEAFGVLESLEQKEVTITRQIEAAYQTDCAKEAFGRMNGEGMEQILGTENWQEMTPEQLLWQLREAQDAAREDSRAYYQEQLKQFADCQGSEDTILRQLTEYEMPVTAYNMQAVGQMVNNRNHIFRQLFDPANLKKQPDLEEAKQTILENFAEAVKTPEDMAKAQKALAETAENVMKTMVESEDVSSSMVRDLRILRQEIQLSTKMSREENYAIPVLVGDELTNVQLKIVRGKEVKGRVDILFETERLGNVTARLQTDGEKISGYVAADSSAALQLLEKQDGTLKEMLGHAENHPVSMNYIKSDSLNTSWITREAGENIELDNEQESYQIQTRQLYGMAKAFLTTIKTIMP